MAHGLSPGIVTARLPSGNLAASGPSARLVTVSHGYVVVPLNVRPIEDTRVKATDLPPPQLRA